MADLAQLLEDVEHVIVDFDGPISSLYRDESAADVAERLRKFAAQQQMAGVLAAARRSERVLSIVSNNSREAVEAYLTEHGLIQHFEAIEARTGTTDADADADADVDHLKPHPQLLIGALDGYIARHGGTVDEARRAAVFVGDSMTDIQAAKAAGIRCVALADDPSKRRSFEDSDAAAVITGMQELADALNARWDAQWCARQYCC